MSVRSTRGHGSQPGSRGAQRSGSVRGPVCRFSCLCHLVKTPDTHPHGSLSVCDDGTEAVFVLPRLPGRAPGVELVFRNPNMGTFEVLSGLTQL